MLEAFALTPADVVDLKDDNVDLPDEWKSSLKTLKWASSSENSKDNRTMYIDLISSIINLKTHFVLDMNSNKNILDIDTPSLQNVQLTG